MAENRLIEGNYLIDSNIWIDFFRGSSRAIEFVRQMDRPYFISTITLAELFGGVREREERAVLEEETLAWRVVPIDREIARVAGIYGGTLGKAVE